MKQGLQPLDWSMAENESVVCYCRRVTKKQIVDAIEKGANSLEAISELSGAGSGNQCLQLNPLKRCCHSDIIQLLKLYSPETCSDEPRTGCCK